MREILFRGKRTDNGEWVYGDLIQNVDCLKIREQEKSIKNIAKSYEVDLETVGQFTGLLDENGKKIFEGDIIRYAELYEYNCYIESLDNFEAYDNVDFGDIWTVDEVVYGIKIGYPAFDLNRHNFEVNGLSELNESGGYFYEVIGNIYDNPELLEGLQWLNIM